MNSIDQSPRPQLVSTVKELCKVCYTCVRECPVKAIRIFSGQAEVIKDRCIGCGNCVRVCSQNAKEVVSSIKDFKTLASSGKKMAACIAPSFPAEFSEIDYQEMVGILRAMGFARVCEVAFGADLVANRYYQLLKDNPKCSYIASNCPAIIEYIGRYHPSLINSLAPIVSPMIATSRALKHLYGHDLKIVFIGPCIAKKIENDPSSQENEIDIVLTFIELRKIMGDWKLNKNFVERSDFDQPAGYYGGVFPISRGMIQAANIQDDLAKSDIVVADGRNRFPEAIKEFESGDMEARLLEVLCCNGCIMGPGISKSLPLFRRQKLVSKYVYKRQLMIDQNLWRNYMERLKYLDLSREFVRYDQPLFSASQNELTKILRSMGKFTVQDELNCGACGYETCRDHASAICQGLAEPEMCLPYTIENLRKIMKELADSNTELAKIQAALIQSEKLASMGQLAAAIAHEINNPLGVVLMYSHLVLDEIEKKSKLSEDITVIIKQTERCKKIISGLLQFSRQNKVLKQPTNIRNLLDQGLKSVIIPDGVTVDVDHQKDDIWAELDGDQILQVIINIINNSFEAMPNGGNLTIRNRIDNNNLIIEFADTGTGISEENIKKIFDPFFTTKQIGKGIGLGLAVSYGIVKMHCGNIQVRSNKDSSRGPTGTTFIVSLPVQ